MARTPLQWLQLLLFPGGLIVGIALATASQDTMPAWVGPLVSLLPSLVYLFGLVLGWVLDRARLVTAMFVLLGTDRALWWFVSTFPAADPMAMLILGLISLWLPLNLLLLSALGERSLRSHTMLLPVGLLAGEAVALSWLCQPTYQTLGLALLNPAIDPSWTAWSPLPQISLCAFLGGFGLLSLQFLVAPTVVSSSALWVFAAAFAGAHLAARGASASALFGAAALIECWASVTTHYRTAYRDALTGMHSHAALDRALSQLGRRYAIAIVDIDRLREVNSHHSETIGDLVLREVAAVLAGVTQGGKAFRYSGEEFAVLFPGRSSSEVLVVMEQLRKRVAQAAVPVPPRRASRPRHGGAPDPSHATVSVTVSIGLADSLDHPSNTSDVIRAAYRAVTLAKLDGGNRVTRSNGEPEPDRAFAAARR